MEEQKKYIDLLKENSRKGVLSYATNLVGSEEPEFSESELQELEINKEQAEAQLMMDIASTKQTINKKKEEYKSALVSIPFNSQKIIDAKRELDGYEKGLKELEKLKQELF